MIGLYSRVSTTEQAQNGFSLDEQVERMKKYCEAMGWTDYKVYTDAGFSGGNTNRPALQRMIRDVKKLDRVLVYKLDRLSRSQKDTLMLIEDVFLANGCDFVSMSENFDTSTPFGRAMIGILAVFAQLERDQIRERMMMGKEASVRAGGYQGGRFIPFGYQYENGNFIIDPYQSMVVKEMFKLASEGKGLRVIANHLNERGMTKDHPWTDYSISRILSSKVYLGYKRYRGEWYRSHDPIIDDDLFESVRKVREKKRIEHDIYNRRLGKASTYLGGYLICGKCGAKYAKTSASKTRNGKKFVWERYSCNSRCKKYPSLVKDPNCKNKNWKIDDLDNLIFGEIKKLALEPDVIEETTPTDDTIIKDEIKKLDDQMDRLMDLYTIGEIPIEMIQNRIKTINDRKTALESVEIKKEPIIDHEMIDSFEEILEKGDYDDIRACIGALIDYIVLDDDDVEIHWTFS